MSKRTIKVGDKIKITDASPGSIYENGDVMTVISVYDGGSVDTTFGKSGANYYLYAYEFELTTEPVEKVIKFEDIHKGDRIRVTFDEDDLSNIGVASELSADWWYTPKGRLLLSSQSVAVITLLDRPKPELPNERGSVIIATEVRGMKGRWVMLHAGAHGWLSASHVDGHIWHKPERITEWEPAEVVPVGAE